jgi:hypothetical protein
MNSILQLLHSVAKTAPSRLEASIEVEWRGEMDMSDWLHTTRMSQWQLGQSGGPALTIRGTDHYEELTSETQYRLRRHTITCDGATTPYLAISAKRKLDESLEPFVGWLELSLPITPAEEKLVGNTTPVAEVSVMRKRFLFGELDGWLSYVLDMDVLFTSDGGRKYFAEQSADIPPAQTLDKESGQRLVGALHSEGPLRYAPLSPLFLEQDIKRVARDIFWTMPSGWNVDNLRPQYQTYPDMVAKKS